MKLAREESQMKLLTFMCPPADDSQTDDARFVPFPYDNGKSKKLGKLSANSVRFQIKAWYLCIGKELCHVRVKYLCWSSTVVLPISGVGLRDYLLF